MNLDRFVRRFFPVIVGALIAIAAYFQADGLMSIAAVSMVNAESASDARSFSKRRAHERAASAAPILARNAFDSVTGPLDGRADVVESAPSEPKTPEKCAKGWVSLIVTSEDPGFSFAMVGSGAQAAEMYRFGDEAEALGKIQAIEWNRVWIDKPADDCFLALGERPKAAKAKAKPRAPKTRKKSTLQKQIAEKIEKVGENHYKVDRSAVDLMLRGKSSFMRSARLVQTKDGPVLKLNGRVRRTALGELGFKPGDQIKSINGFDMGDPEKALEAYSRLSSVNEVNVELIRKSKPVTLEFDVR